MSGLEYSMTMTRMTRNEFLSSLPPKIPSYKKEGKSKTRFLNVSSSFDIESTSFYMSSTGETRPNARGLDKKEIGKTWFRQAVMYAWVFTLNGKVTTGRTWKEFIDLMNDIRDFYHLNQELILCVYVHNLAYEMQWIRHRFSFTKVFAMAEREPIYARTSIGIEFRCSLKLSGYSLARTAENLKKYKIKKMVGDLDYLKMRNPLTSLDKKEWGYIVHDGLAVSAYIQEQIEENGNITKIPLTKTGFVRRYLRNACFFSTSSHKVDYGHKYERYRRLMNILTLEVKEYKLARRCFQGGIVHASSINEGVTYEDVGSMDFTSSYPYVMISEKYPMSKGEEFHPKTIQEFEGIMETHLAIFDVEFFDIESSQLFEHLISSSKCVELEEPIIDNGRIVSAKHLKTSLTSVDYKMLKHFYKWKRIGIGLMYIYRARYLPTDFVKAVIKLYKDKTTLKDVDDENSKALYQGAKELLNSTYGCMVMDVCRPEIKYKDGEWVTEEPDIEKAVEKYNNDRKRFSSYAWGVFITAYARYNLSIGIRECGRTLDYIYCDTDSVKTLNIDKHMGFFNRYNAMVERKLRRACEHHGIPFEDVAPKTIKGETKMIGVWDFEYRAKYFKAMRAKCYAYEIEGKGFNITIAGVNKKVAVPKLEEIAEKEKCHPLDLIKWGMLFDEDTCGKNLHSYIDDPIEGYLTDYQGHRYHYEELSCVHLEPTTYRLEAGDEYLAFLDSTKEMRIID